MRADVTCSRRTSLFSNSLEVVEAVEPEGPEEGIEDPATAAINLGFGVDGHIKADRRGSAPTAKDGEEENGEGNGHFHGHSTQRMRCWWFYDLKARSGRFGRA